MSTSGKFGFLSGVCREASHHQADHGVADEGLPEESERYAGKAATSPAAAYPVEGAPHGPAVGLHEQAVLAAATHEPKLP